MSVIDELVGCKTSKGTVRFTLDKPLSDTVIEELVAIRLAVITEV